MRAELPVLSLFTGAGGLDLGIEDAGGTIRVCVEPDLDCAKTLLRNRRFFPDAEVIPEPLENVTTDRILDVARLGVGEAALLVGGSPCQPWSKSGYWLQDRRQGLSDPRALLLNEFVRVLEEARPAGFIFENVPSILHPSHRDRFNHLLNRTREAGYSVNYWRLNAAEFGTPQKRTRVMVTGLRGNTPAKAPNPTHWWRDRDQRPGLRPPETAGNWLKQFSSPDFAEPEEAVTGRWAEHLRSIPPGWNYKWHTAWAGHPNPEWVTETKFWTFLLKLSPQRSSWTIQASPGPWTGPFHWESRRLRLPEMAALQTFPPSFRFEGDPRSVRRQIGNAVPCRLSSAVAATLLRAIGGTDFRRGRRLRLKPSDSYPFADATERSQAW